MKHYTITLNFDLSNYDIKVLSLLYMPLINMASFSLYMALYSYHYLKSSVVVEEHQLLDHLNLKTTLFKQAREKLEAFELLETYQKDEDIILKLKSPLTAKQFLSDTIFGSYLQAELGESYIQTMIVQFQMETTSLEHYQNMTKSFDEVFEVKHHKKVDIKQALFGNGGHQARASVPEFSFETWIETLPKRYQQAAMYRASYQQHLSHIAYIYQLTPEQLKTLILKLTPEQALDHRALNLQARLFLETLNQSLTISTKDKGSLESQIGKLSPFYIIEKYALKEVQGLALQTVADLTERHAVDMGIINVLVMFVLKRKDGVLPHVHYLEKILQDWLYKGVRTTEDALKMISELEVKYTPKVKTTQKSVEPDWLESYFSEIKKKESLL
jgi:replication initiation and membrane attachment protein